MDYYPWNITKTLYNQRGTAIYETDDSRWVLKDIENETRSMYELQMILRIIDMPPRHSIKLPSTIFGLYGRTPTSGWFAMKRYNGCVDVNDFCKTHWRTLAIHVLQFLQDFHHEHGLIHMDIKKGNILVDMGKTGFVVTDYEHADKPDNALTSSYDDNHKWYYLAMGAEIEGCVLSWRFDLVALGYVLGSLTVEPAIWSFEQAMWDKRQKQGDLLEVELIAQRNKAVAAVNPEIARYLERVAEIPWDAKEPPAREFYEELEAIFMVLDENLTCVGTSM